MTATIIHMTANYYVIQENVRGGIIYRVLVIGYDAIIESFRNKQDAIDCANEMDTAI